MGPLGAINAALRHAADHGFDGVLVTGCDMPVFPAALVDALVGDGGAVLAGQQLAGWWPASLADMLDDHLAHAQNRSIRGWMARAKAREVSMDGMAMPNINRPEDLALIGLHVAVLAAGAGRRFGGGKLDADLAGRPVAAWALGAAQALGASVHVVAGPDVPACLAGRADLTINPDAASGMGSSLRHALGAAAGQGACW
jgi:molybdopterin-guanine dinucleotide biosynthesis protein A